MTRAKRSITQNASVLMGSQLTTWILALLLTIFLPRYLGAAGVGKIHFAYALWAIVAIIVAFGSNTLLIKEIARDADRTTELFGTAVFMRSSLFTAAYGGMIFCLHALGYPAETLYVVCLIGIAQWIWQLIDICQSVLQGMEQMSYLSVGNIVDKAFSTVASIILLLLGYGVYAIAGIFIISALINLSIQLIFLARMHPLRLNVDVRAARQMLRAGAPYLFSGFFLVAYMQLDIIIISAFVDEKAVGWYGAADRLFATFLFVPTVLMTAVFPVFSRMFTDETAPLHRLMAKSFDTLLLCGVPIGLGLLVMADPLALLLYGQDFAPSGPILAIMGIVLIFTYQNILVGQFLISTDRQNAWTLVMAAATLATIPLDLVLVPWCQQMFANGAMGGALAFVITEVGMLTAGLLLLPAGMLDLATAWRALRILAAGMGMVVSIWWMRNLFIGIPIGAGATVYIALIWLLRVVPAEDLYMLREWTHHMRRRLTGTPVSATSG